MFHRLKRSTLARNAGWMFAGQGLSFVTQGLYFIALARLLGSAQYGILAGAAAIVAMVSQYSTLGSGLVFLRYVSPDHSRFREYWGNILLCTASLGSLLVVVLYFCGSWLIGKQSVSVLLLLAIGDCCFGQLSTCASQVFQAFERMQTTAALSLMTNLLRLLVAAVMLAWLHHASAFEWATASLSVSALGVAAAVLIVTFRFGGPKFVPSLLWNRAAEGLVFAVSSSTTSMYNDIDKAMMGHFGMNVANGIYSVAYRVINIAAMPVASIHAAAFPRFFKEGVKGVAATQTLARKILNKTSLLGLAASVSLFLLAPVIPYFVGPSFTPSVAALRWLCWIPFFRCFHLSAGDAMAGAGHQNIRLIAQILASGFNFSINLFLIPKYSWLGAAWASLLTDGGLALMNWVALLLLR
jgi:O-antigen/teichoic acid export membrane protein